MLRDLFVEPDRLRPDRTAAQVTEKAAAEFALLAESLRKRGAHPEEAARFWAYNDLVVLRNIE